jgi:hypothetical protein
MARDTVDEDEGGEGGGEAEISAPSADLTPVKVVGRPFQPGVCANPGGRPKDPIARFVREGLDGGAEAVAFLLAVMRDDLDGRMADKGGMIDRMYADALALEKKAERAVKEAGGVFVSEEASGWREEASDKRAKADALRARLARKRKIAVAVKTRVAAAEILLERGWGKPLERVDLTVGNPDGSAISGRGAAPSGPLVNLQISDLAKIAEVFEAAKKREEAIEVEVKPCE